MQIGSAYFNDYTRTVRRVYWAEMIGRQMRERRRLTFRASLVGDPYEPRAAAVTPSAAVAEENLPQTAGHEELSRDGGPGRT